MDCNKTEVYFEERTRMCSSINDCCDCPFYSERGRFVPCQQVECSKPLKAIEIVQKWSDEHPIKTYQDVFLKAFPKAPISTDGQPVACRKVVFGTPVDCVVVGCYACWNEEYKEN